MFAKLKEDKSKARSQRSNGDQESTNDTHSVASSLSRISRQNSVYSHSNSAINPINFEQFLLENLQKCFITANEETFSQKKSAIKRIVGELLKVEHLSHKNKDNITSFGAALINFVSSFYTKLEKAERTIDDLSETVNALNSSKVEQGQNIGAHYETSNEPDQNSDLKICQRELADKETELQSIALKLTTTITELEELRLLNAKQKNTLSELQANSESNEKFGKELTEKEAELQNVNLKLVSTVLELDELKLCMAKQSCNISELQALKEQAQSEFLDNFKMQIAEKDVELQNVNSKLASTVAELAALKQLTAEQNSSNLVELQYQKETLAISRKEIAEKIAELQSVSLRLASSECELEKVKQASAKQVGSRLELQASKESIVSDLTDSRNELKVARELELSLKSQLEDLKKLSNKKAEEALAVSNQIKQIKQSLQETERNLAERIECDARKVRDYENKLSELKESHQQEIEALLIRQSEELEDQKRLTIKSVTERSCQTVNDAIMTSDRETQTETTQDEEEFALLTNGICDSFLYKEICALKEQWHRQDSEKLVLLDASQCTERDLDLIRRVFLICEKSIDDVCQLKLQENYKSKSNGYKNNTVPASDYEILLMHNADLQRQLRHLSEDFESLRDECRSMHGRNSDVSYQNEHFGSIAESNEFEYLRFVLHKLLSGQQTERLIHVVCEIMRFTPDQMKEIQSQQAKSSWSSVFSMTK